MMRLVGPVLALLVIVSLAAPSSSRALPLGQAQRDAIARLAEPISECISRRDTQSPVFHGCFDWHSAVHANLAVRIIARLTGHAAYRNMADTIASPNGIVAEHARLREEALLEELPYGYSWLLLLDREAARSDMHAMATDAAARLRGWLGTHLHQPGHLLATRYASSTFPAYALHRWYSRFAPQRAAGFAQRSVPRLLEQRAVVCSAEAGRPGFLDPCASLLLALSQMAGDADVSPAALSEMAHVVAGRSVVRTADMTAIFEAGLNFSRAWALYAAADETGNDQLTARADRLFDAQMGQPEMWRDGYEDYSHWVAQFGIYALALRSEVGGSGSAPTPRPPAPQPVPLPPIPLPSPPHVPLPPTPQPPASPPVWLLGGGRHLPSGMRPI